MISKSKMRVEPAIKLSALWFLFSTSDPGPLWCSTFREASERIQASPNFVLLIPSSRDKKEFFSRGFNAEPSFSRLLSACTWALLWPCVSLWIWLYPCVRFATKVVLLCSYIVSFICDSFTHVLFSPEKGRNCGKEPGIDGSFCFLRDEIGQDLWQIKD